MKNLLNPKWLLIINTLPVVVLIFLFIGEFNIIQSLLDSENIRQWKRFGGLLTLLGGLNIAYFFYLIFKKQPVSVTYGFIALAAYILFIYLYFYNIEKFFPSNVPDWLLSGHPFLYVITFLMPTLIYSLFIIVTHFTPEDQEHTAWKNFLFAIAIPLGFYLFFQILTPLVKSTDSEFEIHALVVIFITGTLLFLFFLIRGVYIFVIKKATAEKKYQLLLKIPISILFPLLGLAINNGYWSNYSSFDSGIFGNFNSLWFYILAFINGVLICLPSIENTISRLFLFIGRSITMAYTFYFFLVFLPFLPLSIALILAVGAGFLTLTPLLLFVIHIQALSKDFNYLKERFSKHTLRMISIIGFLVIPIYLTMSYLNDKRILNETLDYIYSPDYSKTYQIDKSSLRNTMQVIISHKENNIGFLSSPRIPYLSSYFNWIVLDNLTLSDTKINWIEAVFFGYVLPEEDIERISNKEVSISRISSQSVYEEQQEAWRSRVDLEITNHADFLLAEYATTIDLPEGCWISDYYLYVGDQKEAGILAEKHSAMWVFSQIRNTNRDPGILYYLTGNKVAFRVFPFAKDEVRKTGIEFLHKEPVQLDMDGHLVELGKENETPPSPIVETDDVLYVPAQQKQTLKQVQRNPYFHFLVDVSKEKKDYFPDFSNRIKRLADEYPEIAKNARISFVNTYVAPFPFDNEWEQTYQSQTFEGSFYLDRAIKTALFNAYSEQGNSYPILVVVTDNIQCALLSKDFSDFKLSFPESDLFINLKEGGKIETHSLIVNPVQATDRILSFDSKVLEYKSKNQSIYYLPDNNETSILLKSGAFEIPEETISERSWHSALLMHGKWLSQIMHPETSGKEWLNLIKYSFISKVMTPATSYLVVENEAQKAILKKKQEQVLAGNKNLDLGEDIQRMSEPDFLVLAILLLMVLGYRRFRERKQAKH
jgi:hypothetical protein